MKRKLLNLSSCLLATSLMALCSSVSFFKRALVSASAETEEPKSYLVEGWNEYLANSLSRTENGIVMKDSTEDYYGFSNTTKKTYSVDGLQVSLRIKDPYYLNEENGGQMITYVGLSSEESNFFNADSTKTFGVSFFPNLDVVTADPQYKGDYAFFGGVPTKTASGNLPYLTPLSSASNVKLTDSDVVTMQFHRESSGKWYVFINALYQLEASPTECEVLESLKSENVHVQVAGYDFKNNTNLQTGYVELFQLGHESLGLENSIENSFINPWHVANAGTTTRIDEEEGIVFECTSDGVQSSNQDLQGGSPVDVRKELDGLCFNIEKEVVGGTKSHVDIGFGTFHGANRCTYWNSCNDKPAVVGSFAIRLRKDDASGQVFTNIMLLTRVASTGHNGDYTSANCAYVYDGNMPFQDNDKFAFNVQIIKVDGNWKVLIDGRVLGPSQSFNAEEFQKHLNATIESMAYAEGESVYPWYSVSESVNRTADYKMTLRIKGIGTRRIAKVQDIYGVDYDKIDGELEFKAKDWVNTTLSNNKVNVAMTDEGLLIEGRNEETGFNIAMNYKQRIATENDFKWTIKPSRTVLPTDDAAGPTYGFYGFAVTSQTQTNWTDCNSILVRWDYTSTDSTTKPTIKLFTFMNASKTVTNEILLGNIEPTKTEGHEGELTFRFITVDNATRVYVNGQRCTNSVDEVKIYQHLSTNMSNKYFSAYASYEKNGGITGFKEGSTDYQKLTVVSINGKKIVNNEPDLIQKAFELDATSTSATSVNLNWTKAEYPVGNVDASKFTPDHYVVSRIKGDATDPEAEINVPGDINTLTFVDTGLTPETYYYYTVYAVDANGVKLMVSNTNKRVQTLKDTSTQPEENPDHDEDEGEDEDKETEIVDNTTKSGCKGSVIATSIIVSSVALLGTALLKGKKED